MKETRNAFGVPTYQYQIRLPGFEFEGPLDLLLQTIERKQLPITQISLANIADEYVSYIKSLKEVNPAELAEFLVLAAKLLLIKSQALLPLPPAKVGNADDAASAAEELLAQLRDYKQMKEAALHLRERQEQNIRSFGSQRVGPNEIIIGQVNADLREIGNSTMAIGLGGLGLSEVLTLVKRRLAAQKQQSAKLPTPASETELKRLVRSIKIEDKIALLERRLDEVQAGEVEFTSLFDPATPPGNVEVIVTFMAVLELLRRRLVDVRQDQLFGEIIINRINLLPTPLT